MTRTTASTLLQSTVSVTIPCLNESKNIAKTISGLERVLETAEAYELIVVNDGSSDETKSIVEGLIQKNPRITLINHSTTMGRGYSIKNGFSSSKYDYLMVVNGKYDINTEQLNLVFAKMGQEPLIISVQKNTSERPLVRRVLSYAFTNILNFSFGLDLTYFNGSSLISRKDFERLSLYTDSYALDAEILIKLNKSGVSYVEVPVNDIIEAGRNTRSTSPRNVLGVFAFYLVTFWEVNILRKRY